MTQWTLIAAHSLVAAPWKNGLGTSREIASGTGPEGGFGWMIGVADLEHDAAFSHYPQADRIFTPIAGDPPPLLSFAGGPFEPCPLLAPKRFPGDVPTMSRIPAPGRAFNVIIDRRHFTAEVEVLQPDAGGRISLPPAPTTLLHCLSARISTPAGTLAPGDSLLGMSTGETAAATEAGVAMVVSIRPTSP